MEPRRADGNRFHCGANSRALALIFTLLLVPAGEGAGQGRVFLRDSGPGRAGALLAELLAAPHALIVKTDTLPMGLPAQVIPSSVVVVARSVTVEADVRGDVVVVGGNLFLHPGARIHGRAIAFGGGIYDSHLAAVHGERIAFRDVTFDAHETPEGYALDYRSLVVRGPDRWSWLAGLRLPTYDRVNGLSVPYTRLVQPGGGAITLEPRATWRSHLGVLDPRLDAALALSPTVRLELIAGRGSWTNDDWIRGDLANSAGALLLGKDLRDYYRADRAYLALQPSLRWGTIELEPRLGIQWERGWSVGRLSAAAPQSAPWSLFGRRSERRMLRPNPPIDEGEVLSAIAGGAATTEIRGGSTSIDVVSEWMDSRATGRRSVQVEIDAALERSGFGPDHLVGLEAHVVGTAGDRAPSQRFRAIGGFGILPMMDPLAQRGDHLVFFEGRYTVPLEGIRLPFGLTPRVTARYMTGAAGVGGLPSLEHNAGMRVTVSVVRADVTTDLRRGGIRVSGGVALGR